MYKLGPVLLVTLLSCMVCMGTVQTCTIKDLMVTQTRHIEFHADSCPVSNKEEFYICTENKYGTVMSSEVKRRDTKNNNRYKLPFHHDDQVSDIYRVCVSRSVCIKGEKIESDTLECIVISDFMLPTKYVEKERDNVLALAKKIISTSHTYLKLSYEMGSEANEKPGMAKYLKELSDYYWGLGIKVYKTFLARGGEVHLEDKDKFDFTVENLSGLEYPSIFQTVTAQSTDISRGLNNLAKTTSDEDSHFRHFFSELMEDETQVARKAAGRYRTCIGLKDDKTALFYFDQSL